VDLSLTPLVSVIETLDPPVVGKVTFAASPPTAEAGRSPGEASDHFTSLLESLDAIASAIQGVVETRIVGPQDMNAAGGEAAGEFQASGRGDLTFRKEIVGLFALEAREWLAHIQTALKKLKARPEGPVRSKLYGFILNGITNLVRSASTVQLAEIEAMASELLPMLREVGETEVESRSESLDTLQAGLDRIATAVHRLAEDQAEGNSLMGQALGLDATREAPPSGPSTDHQVPDSLATLPERVAPSIPLLKALRELQRARARSVQPARDMLEAVIDRAGQEVGAQQDDIAVETVERILRELDRMDDQFLREVHDRVPAITGALMRLREQGPADFVTSSQLDPILADVESLYDCAKTVHATTIMMFLQGMKAFLTATVYRKIETLPQRLQALEERLMALIPMAQQWVTLGRIERASIEDILPV
jgi:chemotaxis protein histidine kinase CheA